MNRTVRIFVFAALGVAALLSSPAPAPSQTGDQAKLDACVANLKVVHLACEMYSSDNSGRYPDRLDRLVPEYLAKIPDCPAAGTDTYSGGYMSRAQPDWCVVGCGGPYTFHHQLAWPTFPRWDSYCGLVYGYVLP